MAIEKCPECGNRRVEDEAHCPMCGYTFPVKAKPPVTPDPPPRPVSPVTPVGEGNSTASQLPVTTRTKRSTVPVVLGAVVLLVIASGAGVAALSNSGSTGNSGSAASGTNSKQSGSDGPQNGATADSSVSPAESGTWIGDAGSDTIALSLGVDDGEASGVFRVRKSTGAVGSWYVSGTDDAGNLQLSPGDWISQPSGWSAAGLDLTHYDDGSMDGQTTGGESVTLERISTGTPDAAAVSDDWRNALAMDEATAEGVLEDRRQQDADTRDSLDGYWVAQVASGCEGLTTDQWPLTNASILATHARLEQEIGAITVAWEDIATSQPENCPGTTMWVSLVPKQFSSSAAALRWCHSNSDSCAARYIVPRGVEGTKIEY